MKISGADAIYAAYLTLFVLCAIGSVVYAWGELMVRRDFLIILPEGGIENIEVEEEEGGDEVEESVEDEMGVVDEADVEAEGATSGATSTEAVATTTVEGITETE